ncbi:hypothetical protein C2S51_014117 [Perilla frutescens var. frutescens]|nr:hypothetical protein C2S51_014117 [Perilla frutescens var. frutescens]
MDLHGGCTAEKATGVERWCLLAKKTLQFIAMVSFFSFFYSYYFSGFSSCNLHLSTFIFSLLAHTMDRKYMILICNVILTFLVKNLTFKIAEDGVKQITEMPAALLLPENVEYGVSPVAGEEETEQQLECSCQGVKEEEEEEEEEEELQENKGEQGTSTVEEVSDANVSTEELNQKIEEFIKKIKEEIRIEAQQQPLITV